MARSGIALSIVSAFDADGKTMEMRYIESRHEGRVAVTAIS